MGIMLLIAQGTGFGDGELLEHPGGGRRKSLLGSPGEIPKIRAFRTLVITLLLLVKL